MAVAAFTNGKLAADLQQDLGRTMRESESWAVSTYARALGRRDGLSEAERDSIVRGLSRFTGLDPTLIDRKTLTVDRMQLGNYLLRREGKFVGQYDTRMVGPLDTAQVPYDPTKDPSLQNLLDDVMVLRYLRDELGYRSDLRYQGPFGGGYPPPTAFRGDWMSVKWKREPGDSIAGERSLHEAMRLNPTLRVLSGCGIYDLVCDYYGNVWSASHLDVPAGQRVVAYRYPGGHAMYTDPQAHRQLAADVTRFIRDALASP
jgi:carboxypeptidase C (cathepsin A)